MLVPKDLCEEKQMGLKFRKVKWKVLESFLRDGNTHLTDIVCTVLCLWGGYLFIYLEGDTMQCPSESQRGLSVIL